MNLHDCFIDFNDRRHHKKETWWQRYGNRHCLRVDILGICVCVNNVE